MSDVLLLTTIAALVVGTSVAAFGQEGDVL